VPPAGEAVLAWAVREGVTNVVRPSRARHCTIRFRHEDGAAGVEVADDGRGDGGQAAPSPQRGGGSGLPGLQERAVAMGGSCQFGGLPGGGFQLTVTLPGAPGSVNAAAGERPSEHRLTTSGSGRQ
jgi:two-component system sensor histidine kinase DesK